MPEGVQAQRWVLRRRPHPALFDELRSVAPDPVLAQVLYARKVDTPDKVRAFLHPEGPLANPRDLAGVPEAVDRIARALRDGEEIVVYGDFDADGVCATTLLVAALREAGAARVSPFVPDRFTDGYGLTLSALENLHSTHPDARLVVTVDCGVRSPGEVEQARAMGLEMIITDHHELASDGDGALTLPAAIAVINPKREDSAYPFRDLAGVGVAYRLIDALYAELGHSPDGQPLSPEPYLDLVALGTVADVVPLLDENRLLVLWGLQRMCTGARPGLRALMGVAGVTPSKVHSGDCGYRLGPRINAAGRLETAAIAYQLLLAESDDVAQPLASQLDAINQERQQLLDAQLLMAEQQLGPIDGRKILIVDSAELHEGIVGLVASRLADRYHRPALVIKHGDTTSRGSARSIAGFHIIEALDAHSALFERHGGHARAAGFTLVNENLGALRAALADYADEHIDAQMLLPRYEVDAIIPLEAVTEQTPVELARLGPFGEGNPQPALATQNLVLKVVQSMGRDRQHLRLQVTDGKRFLTGVFFRQGALANTLRIGQSVDLIYRPELNEWQGKTELQLHVQALRPSSEQSREANA
ncbi:MAG: single-stranded-DNA-specific exonuclease RecJ [Chloroflexi bacterium]|nr:single-stranded-DNA-specific exonuclease RecJ [Chloroflexota bacterium]